MSIKRTGLKTIAGKTEKMKDVESYIFYMIFLLTMWKTVKENRNGFVCLVQPVKKHFISQSQSN
jgi:hypothetical protein